MLEINDPVACGRFYGLERLLEQPYSNHNHCAMICTLIIDAESPWYTLLEFPRHPNIPKGLKPLTPLVLKHSVHMIFIRPNGITFVYPLSRPWPYDFYFKDFFCWFNLKKALQAHFYSRCFSVFLKPFALLAYFFFQKDEIPPTVRRYFLPLETGNKKIIPSGLTIRQCKTGYIFIISKYLLLI